MQFDIYKSGIRPLLFSGLNADPEWLHQQVIQLLNWLDSSSVRPPSSWILEQLQQLYCRQEPSLGQTLWGVNFPNPVGLAAGFDKNGIAATIWDHFGFGFAEVGTVTLHPQPGNPLPRLFRLLEDNAVLNRMGFNNDGAATMASRLKRENLPSSKSLIPIGINLGKSKITPLDESATDYLGSFRLLKELGDYFVINVSSPNTPGLRSLQSAEQLSLIFESLQQENQGKKPLLVKIAPDLEADAIVAILELIQTYQLAGIIATNTTISRENLQTQMLAQTGKSIIEEAGGISGAPVRKKSTEIIRFIYQQSHGKIPIIGVGGIFTAEDAWEKITAGASLLQVYTGWIYEGPVMVSDILKGLSQKLASKGFNSLSEAVGIGAGCFHSRNFLQPKG